MLFKKKKGMLDIRELQRRGTIKIPEKEVILPTNKQGFVEIKNNSALKTPEKKSDFFGYKKTTETKFSNETDGYNKREVDAKIIDLDNKIYKLEQRIELLERKVGVGDSSNSGGMIGW